MSGPAFYKNHICEEDSIESAIQSMYENIMVRKSIVLCLSDADTTELYHKLRDMQFPANCLLESDMEDMDKHPSVYRILKDFLELPNQLLITTVSILHHMPKDLFYDYIMPSNVNLVISNDIPSHRIDSIMLKLQKGHQQGFWDNQMDTFHLLWYMS